MWKKWKKIFTYKKKKIKKGFSMFQHNAICYPAGYQDYFKLMEMNIFFFLFQGMHAESLPYYVQALTMNPKAENAWNYLRISLRYVDAKVNFITCY